MKVSIIDFKKERHSRLSSVYVFFFLSKITGDLQDKKGEGFEFVWFVLWDSEFVAVGIKPEAQAI